MKIYLLAQNKTARMRLKNGLNILLHTVSACYTHFSDDYLLTSMIIYMFIKHFTPPGRAFCAFGQL